MAKGIREVQASDELGKLVDDASAVDLRVKDLEVRGKVLREQILELSGDVFTEDESSVQIIGVEGRATLTKVPKAKADEAVLDGVFRDDEKFREAVESGSLSGLVERKPSLVVAPGDVAKALEALKAAGVACGIRVDWKVDAKALRTRKASADGFDVTVRGATIETTDYRVKYERG